MTDADALPERSRATPGDLPDDAPDDAPESFEYVLTESDAGLKILELCHRDEHRCIEIDGAFHCADCEFVESIPDDGVQLTLCEGGGSR